MVSGLVAYTAQLSSHRGKRVASFGEIASGITTALATGAQVGSWLFLAVGTFLLIKKKFTYAAIALVASFILFNFPAPVGNAENDATSSKSQLK